MRLLKVYKIDIPPDKSISHRAVMLASIAKGTTRIKNLLISDDIRRTIEAFRGMGVDIKVKGEGCRVKGVGMQGLRKPRKGLYLGNSGTTMRILPGILAGQDFEVMLTGDASLSKRPMSRIAEPLRMMGASIAGFRVKGGGWRQKNICPPLRIRGGKLKAIKYRSKIASAQVKSCILLAGLFAKGVTRVTEPMKSRDHTERMLKCFGCRVQGAGCKVSVKGPAKLKSPGTIVIPGDISSAAFFIVAGCILPNTKIILKNIGLNTTRTGVIDILKRMGANIRLQPRALSLEPAGDIVVKSSELRGIAISPEEVVRAIDEIPIIMLAACFAKGATTIRGIGELRVKETDRVRSMTTNLRKIGAQIEVKPRTTRSARVRGMGEGLRVKGGTVLRGAQVSSYGDHRTAMSMLVANLAINGKIKVTGLSCVNKSFPKFLKLLHKLN